jgi:uncharacterized protein
VSVRTIGKLQGIEEKLRDKMPLLENEFKVKELAIFGSYVRGEQKKTSDLDILVEFSEPVGLFHFIDVSHFLTELLGIKVDLVMKSALKPALKDRILEAARFL